MRDIQLPGLDPEHNRLGAELTMLEYTEAKARAIGREHGVSAAGWVFDGNTTDDAYRWVLRGLEDGDPEVLDTLPHADLSGEWADGYTPRRLYEDIGWPLPDDADADTFCDAYEQGFEQAVSDELERVARYHLEDQ